MQKGSPISRSKESPSAICLYCVTSYHHFQFLCDIVSSFPISPCDKMILSSSFARRRILPPAIAGLIFFHFFANGDHKQTVYKSKNLKQFRIAIQKARMKKSAGKILMKSTKVPRPPSLPLQIFWEYGKVPLQILDTKKSDLRPCRLLIITLTKRQKDKETKRQKDKKTKDKKMELLYICLCLCTLIEDQG